MPILSSRGAGSARGFGFGGGAEKFMEATGGSIATSGDFKIHTFTSPGTFSVTQEASDPANNQVEYLVVAGGGGGAGTQQSHGGGGGGGGFLSGSGQPISSGGFPVSVGGGGSGSGSRTPGSNGSSSSFMVLVLLEAVEVEHLLETLVDLAVEVETTSEAEALEVVVYLLKETLVVLAYLLEAVAALVEAVENLALVNLLLVHHMVEMAAVVNQLQ